MTDFFNDGILMQPVLPKLSVFKLTTTEHLEELAKLMREHPQLFPRTEVRFAKARGNNIYNVNPFFSEPDDLAALNDYLVTSENGARYITSNPTIKHGVIEGIPSELLVPLIAVVE